MDLESQTQQTQNSRRMARRQSITSDPPGPQPQPPLLLCKERDLYPVYEPLNPQHNSSLVSKEQRRRRDAQSSSDAQMKDYWATVTTEEMPLKKRRSRWSVLKPGWLRRRSSGESRSSVDSPAVLPPPTPGDFGRERRASRMPKEQTMSSTEEIQALEEGSQPVHGESQLQLPREYREVTTEEDLVFGAHLCRAGEPWSSLERDSSRVSSVGSAVNAIAGSAPAINVEMFDDTGTVIPQYCQDPIHLQSVSALFDEPNLYDTSPNSAPDPCLLHALSMAWDQGPDYVVPEVDVHRERFGIAHLTSSTDQEVAMLSMDLSGSRSIRPQVLDDVQSIVLPARDISDVQDTQFQDKPFSNGVENPPDPEEGVCEPNDRPIIDRERQTTISSQPELNTHPQPAVSTMLVSRNCSAEVKIAFPGVYHEMLEQWKTQNQDSLTTEHNTAVISPMTDHSDLDQTFESLRTINESPPVNENSHNPDTYSSEVLAAVRPSESEYVPYRGPVTDESQHRNSEARHSFGLHMSLSESTDVRTEPSELGERVPPPWRSFAQSIPAGNRTSHSSEQETLASLFSESEYSSHFRSDGTTSAGVTSPTSESNGPWSPVNDGECSFDNPFKDEYYLVDGKTSSHFPDRGDDLPAIKAASSSEGTVRHVPCPHQQRSSNRPRTLPGIPPPRTLQFGQMGESDSDEYLPGLGVQSEQFR
ncbi:hypothetical protein N7474_010794 [Penicillium riverlandense]|uniref:uncharacterized protein n=1 Tax=Penicillium riverlandense TaxID=1903569 RepID=UPI002549270A|nr:uncharacterized protein N7474_010794 [Penicillium riverlandense]KAJ5804907.1 hypothetical protein N7474_010794 [Penicillium riverlandense]